MATQESPAHPVFAAMYDPATALAEKTLHKPHREVLARDLHGSVLDVGAGTGAMFPYFAATEGETASFHAVEPDPHMRRRAQQKADDLSLDVDIREAGAETLPYADDQFDIVIASLVFCTIPDVEAALTEVNRVLRPGGEFRFFEHVADDGWRERLQTILEPLWKPLVGGCHLTRQTASVFAAEQSFDVVEMDRIDLGITPIRPYIRGRLRKRA